MKILVTGGAGFIGSNFIRFLLKKRDDIEIINLDKLTYAGNLDNLKEIDRLPNYTFVRGDIADGEIVDRLVSEVEVVINYAAQTHVDRSLIDPSDFLRTSGIGTHKLLEAVLKYKTRLMIHISTDEVYGDIEEGKFTEDSPFFPNNPYAAAKASGDLLCRSYVNAFQAPVIVTHGSNMIGPNQYPEKVLPLFITNLLIGKKITLHGDGSHVREYMHVLDHCRAIEMLMENGKSGKIYNICSGHERTTKELAHVVLDCMEYKDHDAYIEYIPDRYGNDMRYSMDNSRIFKDLGWKPQYTFEDTVKEVVDWYRSNQDWWKKIIDSSFFERFKYHPTNIRPKRIFE